MSVKVKPTAFESFNCMLLSLISQADTFIKLRSPTFRSRSRSMSYRNKVDHKRCISHALPIIFLLVCIKSHSATKNLKTDQRKTTAVKWGNGFKHAAGSTDKRIAFLNSRPVFKHIRCTKYLYHRQYPCGGGGFKEFRKWHTCLLYSHKTKLSWKDSRRRCEMAGADLIDITSSDFNKDVTDMLKHKLDAWIGLRLNEERRRTDARKNTPPACNHDVPSFGSSLSNGRVLRSTPLVSSPTDYSNWVDGSPPNETGCVAISPLYAGKWDSFACDEKKIFICQRKSARIPSTPTLVEMNDDPHYFGRFYGGTKLKAACIIHNLDPNHDLAEFTVSNKRSWAEEAHFRPGDTEVGVLEERYVVYEGRCLHRFKLSLETLVTSDLDDRILQCCARGVDKDWRCSRAKSIEVWYNIKRPKLTVNFDEAPAVKYVNTYITASCKAFVGKGGRLTIALVGPVHTASKECRIKRGKKLALDCTTLVSGHPVKHPEVSSKGVPFHVYHDRVYGPRMRVNYTISKATTVHHNWTVLCSSRKLNMRLPGADLMRKLNDFTVTKGPVIIRYPPSRPNLMVSYHEHPSIVHNARILEAVCLADLGTSRVLTWRLDLIETELKWTINIDTRLVSGPADVAHVSYQSDYIDEFRGFKIISTWKTTVKYALHHLSNISCYSRYDSDGDGGRSLSSESEELIVQYLPRKPVLTHVYEDASPLYKGGVFLIANCTAPVGTYGVMTWMLPHGDHIDLWWVSYDGKVTRHHDHLPDPSVEITQVHVFWDEGKGPIVTSTLKLEVTEHDEGSLVYCISSRSNATENETHYSFNATITLFNDDEPAMLAKLIRGFQGFFLWLAFAAIAAVFGMAIFVVGLFPTGELAPTTLFTGRTFDPLAEGEHQVGKPSRSIRRPDTSTSPTETSPSTTTATVTERTRSPFQWSSLGESSV